MTQQKFEAEFEIVNELGLHARAAAQLVKVANEHPCEVMLVSDGHEVSAKSIMGVLMLAAAKGMKIKVRADGKGAKDCVDKIGELMANKFGEPA